jgi:cyclin-dependent kinase regulatory subunit CKS1
MSNTRLDFFQITDPVQKEEARRTIAKMQPRIIYSDRYTDDTGYEYRHVIMDKATMKNLIPRRLMEEHEWRQLGIQQSVGWKQYMIHRPEPHVLLFRRPQQA